MKIIAHHPKKTGHRWKRSRWVPPHAYHDGAAGLLEVRADRKGPREVRPALLACPGNVVGALREGVPPPKDFLRRAAAQTKRQEEATMEEVRKLTAQFADAFDARDIEVLNIANAWGEVDLSGCVAIVT